MASIIADITGSSNDSSHIRRRTTTWTTSLIVKYVWNKSQRKLNQNTKLIIRIHLKMSPSKQQPHCSGLNVLIMIIYTYIYITLCILDVGVIDKNCGVSELSLFMARFPAKCSQLNIVCRLKICLGHFYLHGLSLIPVWIRNYIHYNVWDEITYQFPNG